MVEASMSKRVAFFLAVSFLGQNLNAGEWQKKYFEQPSNKEPALITVSASTEDVVIAFGKEKDFQGNDNGVVLLSKDAFEHSTKEPLTAGLMGQQGVVLVMDSVCPASDACWAVGIRIIMSSQGMPSIGGLLLLTANGGDSFIVPAPPPDMFSRISARDADDFYLLGTKKVASYQDKKLASQFVPKVGDERFDSLLDASFVGSDIVFLVGGAEKTDQNGNFLGFEAKGAVLKSTDGGKTWEALIRGKEEVITHVKFFDENHGFIAGYGAQGPFLRRTDDGGKTFTDVLMPVPQKVPAPDSIMDIAFFNRLALLVVAGGKDKTTNTGFHVIYRMKDGLTLFEEQGTDEQYALLSIDCPSQKRCYAVGENHLVWRFDGTDEDVVEDTGIAEAPPETLIDYGTVRDGQDADIKEGAGALDATPQPPSSAGGGCSSAEGKGYSVVWLSLLLIGTGFLATFRRRVRL
jgi:hypothetical protein